MNDSLAAKNDHDRSSSSPNYPPPPSSSSSLDVKSLLPNPTTTTTTTSTLDDDDANYRSLLLGLPRIHTPDTYARQSRHSVSRLAGCSTMAATAASINSTSSNGNTPLLGVGRRNSGFGSVGGDSIMGGVLLGLNYHSCCTSNTDVPATHPAKMMWHRHQHHQEQHHKIGLAGENERKNINGNNSNTVTAPISSFDYDGVYPHDNDYHSHGGDINDNFGTPLLFSHQDGKNRNDDTNSDIFTGINNQKLSSNVGNGNSNGSSSVSARLTAAVMAKNLENGSGIGENIHEWASNPTSFTNNVNGGGLGSKNKHNSNIGINNNSIVGLTVVEPSSNRNSPALPHPRSGGGGMGGTSAAPGGGSNSIIGGVGVAAALLGRHDKGLFSHQRFMLSPSVVVVGGGVSDIGIGSGAGAGGRASAPPPQSARFIPSILTIGGGGGRGLVVGGREGRGVGSSGVSIPDLVLSNSKQGNSNDNNSGDLRSSTPAVGISITPIADPADIQLLPMNHHFMTSEMVGGASPSTTNVSDREVLLQEMELAAVQELAPFLRGTTPRGNTTSNNDMFNDGNGGSSVSTRGLAILYASSIRCHDVRSTCEAFGALETFRPDFGESRGVFFATYYDLRNAQLAAVELPKILNKLRNNGVAHSSSYSSVRVVVKYCVPLNSSNATDDSMLLLSNLPGTVDEYELSQTLSSFGEVRTIHYQANKFHGDEERVDETSSYLVEFYDVQDAKQALLELEHVHPWGDAAKIEVGTRSLSKRKLGKDLILLLSSWRQGKGAGSPQNGQQLQAQVPGEISVGSTVSTTRTTPSPPLGGPFSEDTASNQDNLHQPDIRVNDTYHQTNIQQTMPPVGESSQYQPQSFYQYPNSQNAARNSQQYQLVVGPDGQHSYVLMNYSPQILGPHYVPLGPAGQPMMFDPHSIHHQQVIYAPAAEYHYLHNPHHQPHQYQVQYNVPAMLLQQPGLDAATIGSLPPTQFIRMPSNDTSSLSNNGGQLFGGTCEVSATSSGSGSRSGNNSSGANSNNHEDESENTTNLSLSIDNVRTGKDCRSSLMVRNIPNKYTQQMLLSEFAAAGHGPNKMDFFYLPIDFKNKCNRGYAFVNFANYKDIIPFAEDYNHRGWKRFNSDKICKLTYARIQGKAAMWKRFENSALMAKDDEYRPKIFVSHGENKGQVENIMPTTTTRGGESDV